jgi:Fungal specific transcription factor domain
MLNKDFWNSYVLPMSISSKPIQHAIIALASQHMMFTEENSLPHNPLTSIKSYKTFLLHNYGLAVENLNSRLLEGGGDRQTVEEILVTCLLFICIDILQANDAGAMSHLVEGLQIFNIYLLSIQEHIEEDPNHPTSIKILEKCFRRLDFQAALYVGSYQMVACYSRDQARLERSWISGKSHQDGFKSLMKARNALDHEIQSAFRFLRVEVELLKYQDRDEIATEDQNKNPFNRVLCGEGNEVYFRRDKFIERLDDWTKAF